MTDLLQRAEENILNRHLLKQGQSVLAAVSGGLDSMVLLHVLRKLSKEHGWKLTVAHFNHQLRGQSSDGDEKLVRKTAVSLKLPFAAGRADVRAFAEKARLSIEMAARKLRHEFFARLAKKRKISVVALAHHADDQVELFFLRLLRGAGSEGLTGMKWRSPSPVDGKILLVRPLLDATKTELRAFARENKIDFREDATNAGLDMPRNRVRNELLPLLRRRYQPALAKAILRLMDIIGAEVEIVNEAAGRWMKAAGAGRIPTDSSFAQLPIAIQRRVLQWQLTKLGILTDFELVERLRCSPDVFVSISLNLSVARDPTGRLSLRSRPLLGFNGNELTINLANKTGGVEFGGVRLHWDFQTVTRPVKVRCRTGCEFFDADKVGGQITLRHWRAGDRFQPIGLKSAVKLQDLFMNQKIPRAERHELIVAETINGEIFWVQQLRMAELFKLTPATKRRLVWRWDVLRDK